MIFNRRGSHAAVRSSHAAVLESHAAVSAPRRSQNPNESLAAVKYNGSLAAVVILHIPRCSQNIRIPRRLPPSPQSILLIYFPAALKSNMPSALA